MKRVRVLIDELLLPELDADEEVRRDGRSIVLRRVIRDYLKRRRRQAIARQYRDAYTDGNGLGPEFGGWENQGRWPPE
jgi:metal-responsive CopG/Arc/MetJ family transcriptional regulator